MTAQLFSTLLKATMTNRNHRNNNFFCQALKDQGVGFRGINGRNVIFMVKC